MRSASRPGEAATGTTDRGSSSLELLIVFPLLLTLVFALVAGALGYHARNVALAAADEGLRAATNETGDVAAGAGAATDFLASSGGSRFLSGVEITTATSGEEVSVTVRGSSLSLLPGIPGLPVAQTAAGPRERFTTG